MSRLSASVISMRAIETAAVLPAGSWRDPAAYSDLIGAGSRALAWELLRRDRGYHAAAARAGAREMDADGALIAASAAFAARWGLHFRRMSGDARVRGASPMGARLRPDRVARRRARDCSGREAPRREN